MEKKTHEHEWILAHIGFSWQNDSEPIFVIRMVCAGEDCEEYKMIATEAYEV